MNKLLIAMEWKTLSGRWDKDEIITDLLTVSIFTVVILSALYYGNIL